MKKPEISIILPFFNATCTLARALESIAAQTFTDFECMLIDNNSNDGSRKIADKFCMDDKRFFLMHESKQGVMHAHNAGLSIAKGKYIARMDADDWMFPDRLERQFNFLEEHSEVAVVAGQAEYIPHTSATLGFQRYVSWSNSILSHWDIWLKQFVESPIINPTVMHRKEISDKHGSYVDGDFPEDYELWLRWMKEGIRFEKLPTSVLKWYDSELRLTRNDGRYSDQAFFRVKSKYLAEWLEIHNPLHPEVAIWGASKISRNRAKLLKSRGIQISNYIDISNKRQLDKAVIFYQDIPAPGLVFILVYLKEETMRTKTCLFLNDRGYQEGVNFLLVS